MSNKNSLDYKYFKDVYDANDDPWNFETSEYEALKYKATIAALPREFYNHVLEIGCSIGVLTKLLSKRSGNLVATDISEKAIKIAEQRCADQNNISFVQLNFKHELPTGPFDLIMVSEVAYYLSAEDWQSTIIKLYEIMNIGGHVALIHWLPEVHDYPQTGDEVHQTFANIMSARMTNVFTSRSDNYRIDIWERQGLE